MNYHRNKTLSTVDRDNDVWSNHCANYAKTFGWFGACCHMCMTTAIGGWPGPNPWWPSDWNHRQSKSLIFWGRFKTVEPPANEPADAQYYCKGIKRANPNASDGIYWIDPDGEGGEEPMKARCDMSGGGWTLIFANYAAQSAEGSWALSWDQTINTGLNTEAPADGLNYLMPLKYWAKLDNAQFRSAASGSINLSNFSLNANDKYKMVFDPTGNGGMDYHRLKPSARWIEIMMSGAITVPPMQRHLAGMVHVVTCA